MLHGRLERVCAAQLGVDDNEADGPVDHDGKANQECGACDEAGVANGVWLANDASTSEVHQQIALGMFIRHCPTLYCLPCS
jgi:hypothetical protein